MKLKVLVTSNPEKLSLQAARFFISFAQKYIKSTGRFTVVLSGGSTPEKLFRVLASSPFKSQVNWKKVFFFFGDERCVPSTNSLSNYRTAKETLFSKAPIPPQNIFRMRGELGSVKGAADYERKIKKFFGKGPVFDLIYLGLGTDGHTASLFPNTKALQEKKRIAVPNIAKGTACLRRITLTFPVINSANHVCFLAAGKDKAVIFKELLKKKKKYPAQFVNPKPGRLLWMVDRAVIWGLSPKGTVPRM